MGLMIPLSLFVIYGGFVLLARHIRGERYTVTPMSSWLGTLWIVAVCGTAGSVLYQRCTEHTCRGLDTILSQVSGLDAIWTVLFLMIGLTAQLLFCSRVSPSPTATGSR